MKINKASKIFLFVCTLFFVANNFIFASDSTTPEPYAEDEFPQWAKDLRRTEIITFGSMPFVTIGVTMGYGGYLYFSKQTSSFPNPFSKGDSSFTEEQQINILCLSSLISVGLGVTDLIVNIIQRNNKQRKLDLIQQQKGKASVNPISTEDVNELLRRNTQAYEDSLEEENIEEDVNDVYENLNDQKIQDLDEVNIENLKVGE